MKKSLSQLLKVGLMMVLGLWTAATSGEQFAIQIGDSVSDGVPAAGAGRVAVSTETDTYTFSAVAGQSVFVEELGVASTFAGWLHWELKAPSGALLFASYFDNNNEGRRTLPETGTYSFRLYTQAGDVRCGIEKGDVVSDGVPVNAAGRIEEPGGQDTYTFEGQSGQRVNFQQISADNAFGGYLYWRIIAPSGSNWFGAYFPGSVMERRTLPETGTYSIRVFANSPVASQIGPYSFRVWCEVVARPDQVATTPNTTLAIPFDKFLCNDSHEIGDVLTVDTPAATTAKGGTLLTTSNAVLYTPPGGFSGTDSFSYRLRGQFGGESTATVSVTTTTGADQFATVVSHNLEGTSSVMVCLLGVPNQNYRIEQSANLSAGLKRVCSHPMERGPSAISTRSNQRATDSTGSAASSHPGFAHPD